MFVKDIQNLNLNADIQIKYESEDDKPDTTDISSNDILKNDSNIDNINNLDNRINNNCNNIENQKDFKIDNVKNCDNKQSELDINEKINIKRKNSINSIENIKILKDFNENLKMETKEIINNNKNQLYENNLIYKENMYLNYDINERNRIESDQINNLIINNNVNVHGNNMTDDEKRKQLVKSEEFNLRLSESSQQNRMRLAIGLLLRIVLPFANGVASRLKNFRTDKIWKMLRNLGTNKQTITNMLAYAANTISLGLSSVQVSHRIDPLIKIIKLKKAQIFERHYDKSRTITSLTESSSQISWETKRIIYSPIRHLSLPKIQPPELIETAEQCVSIKVLAEPPEGQPIRADIIFIHGLHGSLPNTWKQGLWSNERMPVDFERPPKPPLRPPKRPRYSRSNIFVPPHSNKKPRWAENFNENDISLINDNFDYILNREDEKENIRYFDSPFKESISSQDESNDYLNDTDYATYPTFRLRLEDYHCQSPRPRSAKNRPKHAEPTEEDIFPFEQPYSRCWPGDWLPLDCPGVRVIAVNYTTDPHLWRPIWIKKHHRSSMSERVRVMTERLIKLKVGQNHPIVWVGHSKGGLYLKQILVDAWESGKQASAPLWQNSRGVFFYSVPHRGSALADINLPLVRRSIELVEIEKNSKVLADLHRRFVNLYYSRHLKIEVFSFVETAMTFMQVVYLRIVGVDSADPGIGDVCGLQLDHREICKPRSRKCILYTELVKMINKVC
ncbi:uncharacterized protein LOC129606604 [Condylostylus longicornis]|uniref:uncharacterized protein LOC129606604 n=1 Tax=Condylostylus longicornis TaxID=2530218 RepID=UPI00244DB2DC|nr:uncharacterized protein LOC129606604 [Condylostylus longicornis]